MKEIQFTKMTGTGNDFIIFDNRTKIFSGEEADFFSTICRRRVSIGGDGVILLEKGRDSSIAMRYFNSDGREAAMCGNGARCIAYYTRYKGIIKEKEFYIETGSGRHRVRLDGRRVTLFIEKVIDMRMGLGVVDEPGLNEIGFINTGVPHLVIEADCIDTIDVVERGRFYRNHPLFEHGTNVDFIKRLNSHRINIRTYERGVEDETLSCGTGCVASALLCSRSINVDSPVTVATKGGELVVEFNDDWKEVSLTGEVEIVFEGLLYLEGND